MCTSIGEMNENGCVWQQQPFDAIINKYLRVFGSVSCLTKAKCLNGPWLNYLIATLLLYGLVVIKELWEHIITLWNIE